MVSVAVSPWTWGSREPEKRGCLSTARKDFGGLSLSLFLSELRAKPSPPRMPGQLSAFTEAGASWALIQRSARVLEIWDLPGSPVRTGEGRRRMT